MLKGAFTHEDFTGRTGYLGPNDLQWMSAGRGIVHCEMPASDEESHGLQLWVNLSKEDKMSDPEYQELPGKDIPEVTKNGVTVRVISGTSLETTSPIHSKTPTSYLHFKLAPNATHTQVVESEWNGFIYTLEGQLFIGDDPNPTEAHFTVLLSKGDHVTLTAGPNGAHFVLIAGKPIGEPIFQYGPMVMTSQAEIMQAFNDYQMGVNGFEKAKNWKSKAVLTRASEFDQEDDDE